MGKHNHHKHKPVSQGLQRENGHSKNVSPQYVAITNAYEYLAYGAHGERYATDSIGHLILTLDGCRGIEVMPKDVDKNIRDRYEIRLRELGLKMPYSENNHIKGNGDSSHNLHSSNRQNSGRRIGQYKH